MNKIAVYWKPIVSFMNFKIKKFLQVFVLNFFIPFWMKGGWKFIATVRFMGEKYSTQWHLGEKNFLLMVKIELLHFKIIQHEIIPRLDSRF